VTDEELEFLLTKDEYYTVKNALHRLFGTNHLGALSIHQTGSSASHQFLYQHDGKKYLVKLIRKATILNDPERQFTCATLAAQIGISPEVYLSDPLEKIIISEYIEPKLLNNQILQKKGLTQQLAQLIREAHSIQGFPRFMEIYDVIEGLMQSLAQQRYILPSFILHYFSYLKPIRRVLATHAVATACHNDINPRNIIFDGNRLWIIDWESGCLGDPFFDVATAINYFIHGHTREEQFLREYFHREIDEIERGRLFLMKQVSFSYYALTFLNGAARAKLPPLSEEEIAPLPTFHTAQDLIASGVMRLSTPSDLQKLAMIMIKESFAAVTSPYYHKAISLLEARQLNRPLHQLKSS